MSRNFSLPKIYPITDQRISGLSHVDQIAQLIEGGASFIQIRDKQASSREFFEVAKNSLDVTRKGNAKLIVNDRVDIALLIGADGVHLGQDDLPPVHARKLLGDDAIIGFSTHNIEQVREARAFPVDYIAFGPIFGTTTKAGHDPIVGLETLERVRDEIGDVPLVAIGGIDLENMRSVFNAGADSAAVISALLSGPDGIAERTKKAVEIAGSDR